MDARTLKGYWWLPEAPERKVAGDLVTVPDKMPALLLRGSFREITTTTFNATGWPTVLGLLEKGGPVTLHDVQVSGTRITAPGFLVDDLVAAVALIGAHLPAFEAVQVDAAYAAFTHLPEWIGFGLIREHHENRRIDFSYDPPSFPEYDVGGVRIGLSSGWKVSGDMVRMRSIGPQYALRVRGPEHLERMVKERIRPFQNLLTLATGLPNVVTKLDLKVGDKDVEAIYAMDQPRPTSKPLHPADMLFAHSEIEDDFGELLSGWYEMHDRLREVCELYFSARQFGGPITYHFLAYARAVELFDRAKNGNEVRPRLDHRAYVRSLVAAVPPTDQRWLKNALQWSNQPELRTRVRRLLETVKDVMELIVGDLDEFATTFACTRNYQTHHSSSAKKKAATTGSELVLLVRRTDVFIAALLLSSAGLDPARLNALFHKNQDYVWLRRKLAGLPD